MAFILKHIDEIAREEQRDVIWVTFGYKNASGIDRMPQRLRRCRAQVIAWLDNLSVQWTECLGFFDGAIEQPYRGDLFVNVAIDKRNQQFCELERLLEHENGDPRIKGIRLLFVPLKQAQENEELLREILDNI